MKPNPDEHNEQIISKPPWADSGKGTPKHGREFSRHRKKFQCDESSNAMRLIMHSKGVNYLGLLRSVSEYLGKLFDNLTANGT